MEYQTLFVERRGPVGWLIFDRPDALNACNGRMAAELQRAWHELDVDDEVRVIVNTGRGRAFQTGVDMKEVAAAGGEANLAADRGVEPSPDGWVGHGWTAISNRVWKPVICAVNGICAGGAFHFVGDADIVVASSAATFTDPHVSVGQPTAMEPLGLLGRIPFEAIMRMVLVGRFERMSAGRALELGLVSQVIDPERFEAEVQELADKVAQNSPSTMMTSKYAIWQGMELLREQAVERGMAIVRAMWGHPDNAEGAVAFAERRNPRWAPPSSPER
jgi:enoyl-CoA hydratase/carnithine racemase